MTALETPPVGAAIRDEFPIFEHTTYLNSCSQGALSHRVRGAYGEYLDGWDANGAEWEHWVERAEAARSSFARLLHVTPGEVAVTTSVSQGVSGIVSALPFERGDRNRIVISDYEFPTVGQIAHEHGALCLADSYQAVGALDLDVPALGVDFVTGGTVKYLLASAGLGFLYVRRDLLDRLLPTQTGWFADEDIFRMDISDYSPAADARRFDAGTPPVPNIYAGVAGMSIIEDAGLGAIEEHVRTLATRLIAGLDELGATVVTPRDPGRRGPLVCVRSNDVGRLVAEFAAERIVVSMRDDNLRIALHLYNVEADVDRVLEALSKRRHLLV